MNAQAAGRQMSATQAIENSLSIVRVYVHADYKPFNRHGLPWGSATGTIEHGRLAMSSEHANNEFQSFCLINHSSNPRISPAT